MRTSESEFPHGLGRQQNEAQQLDLALGEDQANGLVFRLALEAGAAEGVDRVVFLALRGEEGHVECFWPVPLDEEPERASGKNLSQLQLLTEAGTPPLATTTVGHRRSRVKQKVRVT